MKEEENSKEIKFVGSNPLHHGRTHCVLAYEGGK